MPFSLSLFDRGVKCEYLFTQAWNFHALQFIAMEIFYLTCCVLMQLFISNRLTMSRRQSTRLFRSFPTITPWRLGQIVRRDEGEHYEIGRVSKVISRNEYHVIWNDGTIEKNLSFDEISDMVQYNNNTIDRMIAQQQENEQEEVGEEALAVDEEVAEGLVDEDNSNHAASDEEEQEQVNLEQEQQEPVEQEDLVVVKEVVLVQEDGLVEEDNSDHSSATNDVEKKDLPGSKVYRNVNTSIVDESLTNHEAQESDSSDEDHGDVFEDVDDDEAPSSQGINDLTNAMEALGLTTPCQVCKGRRVHHCFFCR